MSTHAELIQRWRTGIKAACRRHGLRFVADTGYLTDDVYLATLSMQVHFTKGNDTVRITWHAAIKPLALDEILWEAFLSGADLGSG